RSSRRSSLTGLPGPKNIARRVMVAVEHQGAGAVDMGAHAQALLHARSAATTVLRRERRGHQHHSLTGPHCLADADGTERAPARTGGGWGEMALAYEVGDPEVFQIEHIMLPH